jgi:hypothetical protein
VSPLKPIRSIGTISARRNSCPNCRSHGSTDGLWMGFDGINNDQGGYQKWLNFFWLWNFALEFACLWNLWKYCVVFSTRAELVRIGIFEIVNLRLQLFEAPVNYDFEIPGLLCGVRGGLVWIPLSCQVGARSPWFFFSLSFSNLRFFLALSFQICWAPAKLSLNLNLL